MEINNIQTINYAQTAKIKGLEVKIIKRRKIHTQKTKKDPLKKNPKEEVIK